MLLCLFSSASMINHNKKETEAFESVVTAAPAFALLGLKCQAQCDVCF